MGLGAREEGLPWGGGVASGRFRAVDFPERIRRTENEPEVQGEARLGPCQPPALFQEGGTLPGPMALGNALEKTQGRGTTP